MAGPARIVSLVPSTTESLCALGLGRRLVACTRYCEEPADELAGLARVGGTKNPDREAIVALRPDLVAANAEENRGEDLEWLAARVPVVVQTPRSVLEAARCLRDLAERVDAVSEVQPFLLRIEAHLVAAEVAALRSARLRVFYPVWCKPWMSVNRDTYVHDVLRVAGMDNVVADSHERYPEVAVDHVRSRRPDAVLLPSEPWTFTAADAHRIAHERTFGTALVEPCDGRDFCWHGVRMADGLGRALDLAARLRRAATGP